MKVAVYINGQTFTGEEGTLELAQAEAMKRYGSYMRAELSLPEMQGAEDQAWLNAEANAASTNGVVHLQCLVADGIAQWEHLV